MRPNIFINTLNQSQLCPGIIAPWIGRGSWPTNVSCAKV